jgi:hypothetical protein
MKKTTIGLAATALVLTMGISSAFAGDAWSPPDNGVTVFTPVPERNTSGTAAMDAGQPYNGVTVFETPPARTMKSTVSERAGIRVEKEPYNGVTIFNERRS